MFVAYGLYFKIQNNITEIDYSLLKNGDLVLRCGKSTESYAVHIADATSEFTHIGILIFENNNPYVIHAVPHKLNTVKKDAFTDFCSPKKASKIAVYRSSLTNSKIQHICNEAIRFYNEKYVFDSKYDLKTNKQLYCTELILKAFKNSGIQLHLQSKEFNYMFGKHAIIFPSEFTKLPFKKVNINS
ncbi:YiiX/YebB-like N1pC/P60 family cysteine hydrolase [Lutibacter holmesii]|uniref:YiiX/YebB-like N1pC/P60 family cysteine hydrolase n=1 Tax=Lutibacter holmesii TaxID=1137985 RepID=A0ABW3WRS5_9FLAO